MASNAVIRCKVTIGNGRVSPPNLALLINYLVVHLTPPTVCFL